MLKSTEKLKTVNVITGAAMKIGSLLVVLVLAMVEKAMVEKVAGKVVASSVMVSPTGRMANSSTPVAALASAGTLTGGRDGTRTRSGALRCSGTITPNNQAGCGGTILR